MSNSHPSVERTEVKEKTLDVVDLGAVVELRLNRPSAHHALNESLLRALKNALSAPPPKCRIFVLRSSGPTFCAGADLAWMAQREAQRPEDAAHTLGRVLSLIANLPQMVVALVQGRAIGGGVGLLAACDYVLASTAATARLTEGRLGLAPALIAPFLARRSERRALRMMALTGRPLPAIEARAIGLFDELYAPAEEASSLACLIFDLLHTAPGAVPAIKSLLMRGEDLSSADAQNMLQRLRHTEDAQRGIASFFAKTSAPWAPDS